MKRFSKWIAIVVTMLGCGGDDPGAAEPPDAGQPSDDAAVTPQALAITPPEARLGLGETQAFVANVPATFRVVEGGGGKVDESGLYTAPRAFGTYHVEAQSTLDPSQKATATIAVVPRLELVVGKVGGGAGNVDGKGNAARFHQPKAIAAEASALYVADTGNHCIRKADLTTGEVTLLAGRPGLFGLQDGPAASSLFYLPTGIAYEAGSLFVTDVGGLRRINLNTQVVTTIPGIPSPDAVVSDRQGSVFVAGSTSGVLYKVNAATGVVSQLRLKSGGVPSSFSADLLAWHGTSIIAWGSTGLVRVNPTTGEYTPIQPACDQADPYCFVAPTSMAVTGHYLAFTTVGNAVHLLDLDDLSRVIGIGTRSIGGTQDGVGSAARLRQPQGIAADSTGTLFVTDTMNHTVRKIVLSTQQVSTPFGAPPFYGLSDGAGENGRFNGPTSIAVQEGAAYVTDPRNLRVVRVDLATGEATTLVSAPTVFIEYSAIAAGPPGKLFVSDRYQFSEIDIASKQLTHPSSGGLGAAGLAFNGGTVFYSWLQTVASSALPITTNSVLAGDAVTRGFADATGPAARFNEPRGLTVDAQGRLFVADSGNHAIRAVTITDGVVTTPFGAGGIAGVDDGVGNAARFMYPEALALDGKGNLYVADTGNATIRKIDLATSAVTTLIGDPGKSAVRLGLAPAGLSRPTGIAVTPDGDLLIVDNGENAVLRVRQH